MNKKSLIEGHIALIGLTVPRFTQMMGWSRSTYERRIRDPDSITLGEFRRMDNILHFPTETVLAMAKKK